MTCTFFGHRDAPSSISESLFQLIEELIKNKGVCNFYVGHQGAFDRYVYAALKRAKAIYPQIRCAVVLAYLPNETPEYEETIYPLEGVPARFAIDRRNRWMIEQSDFVVTYVKHGFGGAAKFKESAKKKGKTIIELTDICR